MRIPCLLREEGELGFRKMLHLEFRAICNAALRMYGKSVCELHAGCWWKRALFSRLLAGITMVDDIKLRRPGEYYQHKETNMKYIMKL